MPPSGGHRAKPRSKNVVCLLETFKKNNIYPRRYFYPLITEFPMYKNLDSAAAIKLPIAHKVASEVICLPIYPGLSEAQVDFIVSIIVAASEK